MLKTMDSIEFKTQQLKTSLQSLYTSSGFEQIYKDILDYGNLILKQYASFDKLFNKPIAALIYLGQQFFNLANIVTTTFTLIKKRINSKTVFFEGQRNLLEKIKAEERIQIARTEEIEKLRIAGDTNEKIAALEAERLESEKRQRDLEVEYERNAAAKIASIRAGSNVPATSLRGRWQEFNSKHPGLRSGISLAASAGSMALSNIGAQQLEKGNFKTGGWLNIGSSALSSLGMGLMIGGPMGGVVAAVGTLIGFLSNLGNIVPNLEKQAQKSKEIAETAQNEFLVRKDETKTLQEQINKLKELDKTRYDNAEAQEEYNTAASELAEKYPSLIKSIDNVGNVTIDLAAAEDELTKSRQKSVSAAMEAARKNYAAQLDQVGLSATAYANALNKKIYMPAQGQAGSFDQAFIVSLIDVLTDTEYKDMESIIAGAQVKSSNNVGRARNDGPNNTEYVDKQLRDVLRKLGIEITTDENSKVSSLDLDSVANLMDTLRTAVDESYSTSINGKTAADFLNDIYTFTYFDAETNPETLQYMSSLNTDETWSQINAIVDEEEKAIWQAIALTVENSMAEAAELIQERAKARHVLRAGLMSVASEQLTGLGLDLVNSTDILAARYLDRLGPNPTKEDIDDFFSDDNEDRIKIYNDTYAELYKLQRTMSSYRIDQYNNLINGAENLSQIEFENELEKFIARGSELFNTIVSSIFNSETYDVDDFILAISKREDSSLKTKITDLITDENNTWLKNLSTKQYQMLLSYYDQLEDYVLGGEITSSQADALLQNYIKLMQQINNSSLNWEDKVKAWNILQAWDSTPQGLQTIQEQLVELGIEVGDIIQEIVDELPRNFNTERQLLLDQYASANKDFLSWVEKARKGMGLKDATTFAQTFGLDLMSNKFKQENGKWYFTDFSEIFNYYYENLNQQAKSYRQDLEKAKKISKTYKNHEIDWDTIAQLQADGSSIGQYINDEWFDTVLEGTGLEKGQFLDILSEYGKALAEAGGSINGGFFGWLNQYLKDMSIEVDQQAREAWASSAFDSKQFSEMFTALGKNTTYLSDFINGIDRNWVPELQGYAAEYGTQIISNYSSFIDTLSKNFLSGEEIKFENNDMNQKWLEQADIKIDEATAEALYISSKLTSDQWLSLIASIPEAAGAENRKKAYDILYDSYTNNNLAQALLDAAGSTEALSEDQANALASAIFGETTHALESGLFEMLADGTFRFVGDLQTALTTALNSGRMSLKNYNEAIGKIREADFDLSASSIISDIISNRDKISSDNIESLANLLKVQYETVEKFFKDNGDGTFSADISQIENLVLSFGLQTNEAIQSALTDIFDSILSDLTGLVGNQTQGFTGITDMQKYIKQVNDQLGTHLVMQDMFQWSDSLHAFIFTTEGLQNQVRSMAQQLAYMSEEERWAAQKLIQDTGRQFAESIDIFSYINAESSGERDKAEAALRQAVKDYDYYLYSIGNHSYVWISSLMSALEKGGQVAVAAGEQIAALQGKTLTADEVTSLYYASSQGFADAFEALGSYAAGSMMTLSNAVIKALEGAKDIDSALVRIGNTNQFVVKDTKKLVDVYTQLYEQLKTNTNATLAEVNEAYARLAMLNSDNDLIEALNNGAAMSIDTLSEFATKAGYTLEGVIDAFTQANILLDIGGGNYRILDFDRFAKAMNLGDSTSEEYQKALKTYNDGLIEAERYFTEEIVDEVTGLKDAKLGTKVNLTNFEQALFKNADFSDRLDFRTQLFNMGALLKDGVLDIQSQANLPGIIQLINEYAAKYGGLLKSEVAELADTLREVLNSFAEALSKGISGTLTNVEATDLAANAKNMYGIDLRFTQTAEGLKVSTDQAIQLYNRMSQVDSISSKIVFDDLAEELTAAGAACETMSSTLAEIKRLEKEGTSAAQERLNVYRQIAATQMNNPDSYNFMDKKLSNGMQGPVNYWNSVGEMFKTWNEAKANGGKIDVQDFYNIVNELNNLAAIGGDIEFLGHKLDGDMKSAAQLINEGMAALTNIDGKGVKVDLSKFAAEFLTGTTNMGAGVEDGIHAMAQSQMDMLDGLIKLLETIKAMEKLGEIDANTNGVLEFGEMFGELSGGFYEVKDKAQNAAKAILDQANQSKELNKNLSLIKFNNTSLLVMLTEMAENGQVAEDKAHLYNQVMSALYQMVLSGDYDLENLQESILQLMQVNGAIGEIDLGNGIKFAVGYGVTLQPNEKNEYVIGDHKYSNTEVQQALADAAFTDLGLQGSAGKVRYNKDTKNYEQDLTVTDGVSMTLVMDGEGNFKYQVQGQDYDSYKEALYAIFTNTMTSDDVNQADVAEAVKKAAESGWIDRYSAFQKWLATVGEEPIILPTPSLEIDTSNLKSYTQEAIKKAQTEAIKWANGVKAENIDFNALTSIGININASTERSWGNIQQVFSALNIEDKTMNVDVTTNPEDEAAASVVKAMSSDEPIVKDVIFKIKTEVGKWWQNLFSSDNQTITSTEENQPNIRTRRPVSVPAQRFTLTKQLNDTQAELEQVKEQLSAAQQTINDLNNEKAQLDAEIVTLKSQLVENENKITDAELISSDLRDQLNNKEAENLSLTTQITEKQEKINELTKQLAEESQRANQAELTITSLQAEIKELNIKISSLENSMTAFEKRWAERRTQVDIDENSYKEGKAYNLAQDKIDTDEDFYITTKDAANTLYWKMQSLISQPQTGILSAHDVSLNGNSLLPNIEEDEIPYYSGVINKLQSAKIDTFNKLNSAKSINEINEILAAFEEEIQGIKNTGIDKYNNYSIYERSAGMYDKPTDRKEFSDYFSRFVANLLQEATNQARTNKNITPQWSTYEYLPEGIQYNESALMGFSSDDIASLFQKFREFYNTTQNFEETIKYLNEQWPELLNNKNAEDIFKSIDTPPSGGVGDEQPLQTPPEEPIIGSDEVNINGEEVILSGDDINHPFYGADKGETPPSIDETVWNGLDDTIRNDIEYLYRELMPAGGDFYSYYDKNKTEKWPEFSELFPEDAAETLAATGEEFAATTLAATTGLTYMGGQFITLTEQTGTAQDGVSALGNASSVTGGKAYVGRNGINSFGTAIGKFTTDLIDQTTKLANTKIRMPSITPAIPPIVRAKGNVALAAGNQHTLMGELGPELVVSNGHYFVAGQNGAEFVNLPSDAIVFNHLQTEQLLKNGSSGRGKAVTNERKATSMATGNAHGPAFAGGIDAAIAELKRMYAMWKALAEATSKDMGMLAGSGGGGGGGGGKGIDKGFIEDLERWYTILQQIAKLERDINYEEKLRTKLNSDLNKNGYEYYDSQVRSLKSINEQIGKQRELVSLQQGYLNERVNDLNSSVWGQIYHATEDMITYNDTSENAGIRLLAELMRQKENNELVHTGKEQYDILVKNIPGIEEFLKFDPKGEEINTDEDGYGKAVEGFLETADARKDEIQDLIDSVADTKNEILDNENTRNQILQAMMDNQLSLEQEIVKAIEEREQAIIDNLKDTRDALDEAQNAFIDGLSDQLDKERNMYDKQQANEDLNKLRRQLSILQRSGGSASSIASLQEQIRSSEQDTYFEAQQQQIDAIQEASDKEIERLDAQIDLMTETLEYQKEHGLLWNEVYQIMAMEEADILAFIQSNGKDWESKSSLQIEKDIQALKFIIEQYIGRREDSDKHVEKALADTTVSQSQNIEPFQPHHDKKEGSSSSSSSSSGKTGGGGGGSSGGGGYSGKTNTTTNAKKWQVEGVAQTFDTRQAAQSYVHDQLNQLYAIQSSVYYRTYPSYKKEIDNKINDWLTRGIKQYKTGGLVDYTGLAMVHGSKSKPESFIDADTTKFIIDELKGKNGLLRLANRMKQDIQDTIENKNLTNTTTSPVLQQLRQIREMWNDLQNQAYATVQSASEAQRNEASVIIENATVEVNVPSVANDYDSRRIGSQALDEMLRIARKTTSVSINGR